MASDFPFAGYSNIILHFSSLSLFSWFFFIRESVSAL